MRPRPGEVLHFSEDPTISVFRPHIAATARHPEAVVWAVDAGQAPHYFFPRQCPRAMAWAGPDTAEADVERIIGPGGGRRVHAIEYGWVHRFLTVDLYAYRLPAAPFRPIGEPLPHAHVANEPVEPLGPAEPVGDLLQLHHDAGIQLRILNNLWEFWDTVTTSTLAYSGIRLRNAQPRHDHEPAARPG
ncbi:DUF6886 family protein [Streptomyces sp. NBC_01264]|uniref:DUF6886 family protein n=1 Tax=Streptomyces sp. NBC_01264 TaxID=2903804 RepID=UPI00224F0E9E|nr:DUF6886 family protein [Streptomyces sp. NBC_01264]MCX4781518.1 hypothetical protein [Streptomyces sp. NBC_01264]